jgi:Na+/H+ antiporter NhaC
MRARLLFAGVFALLSAPLLFLPANSNALESMAVQSMLRDLDTSAYAGLELQWEHPFKEESLVAALGNRAWTGNDTLVLTPHFQADQNRAWLELVSAATTPDTPPFAETHLGSRLSLFPPLLAILLAFLLRGVLFPLALGIGLGCFLGGGFSGFFPMLYGVFWTSILTDAFHLYILGFVILLSATVGVMTRMGGIEGMVRALTRYAKSSRSVQAVAYACGFGIFFDDYANTIVVGNSCGPLFDRLKVSRAKLAYIVDSTAAPVAGVAILSTWVAYQVSTYAPQLPSIGMEEGAGYGLFLETIPFRFYCLFALFTVAAVIYFQRDFGPMRRTEELARQGKDPSRVQEKMSANALVPHPDATPHAMHGLAPLATLLGVTGWLLYAYGANAIAPEQGIALKAEGWSHWIREVLSKTDSAKAIFMGSLAALGLAAALALGRRLISAKDLLKTTTQGGASLIKDGVLVLLFAWGIGEVCAELGTANYLVAVFQDLVRPDWLPVILFLSSCFIAFATGSSWTTMAIMQPNVVLMAAKLGPESSLGMHGLLVMSIGAVLEGAIFGDHCSPISDTTILSSTASRCRHIDHVKTQAPYALLTAAVALIVGYIPAAMFGVPPWVSLISGAVILAACIRFFAKPLQSEVTFAEPTH